MPAILHQIYATEKRNYFDAPPVFLRVLTLSQIPFERRLSTIIDGLEWRWDGTSCLKEEDMSSAHPQTPVDEVAITYRPTPNNRRQNVLIQNLNTQKSIIATIICDGAINIIVNTFDDKETINYFPIQFDVWIPRGGSRFIGYDLLFLPNDFPNTSVPLTYNITGASYASDEPTPLPTAGDVYNNFYVIRRDGVLNAISRSNLYVMQLMWHYSDNPGDYGQDTFYPLEAKGISIASNHIDQIVSVTFEEFDGLGSDSKGTIG